MHILRVFKPNISIIRLCGLWAFWNP